MEKHLERSLGRCFSLLSNGLRNFPDFKVHTSVGLINLLGIVLEPPNDIASLLFVSMLDELWDC